MTIIDITNSGAICEIRQTAPEFMRQRPDVLFFASFKRMNKKGLSPVYCRITYCGDRAEFSTGITVRRDEFKNGQLLEHARNYKVDGADLLRIENAIHGIYVKLRVYNETVTADKLRRLFLVPPAPATSFYNLVREHVMERLDKMKAENTRKTYASRIRNIYGYFCEKKMLKAMPTEISTDVIEDFENWLSKENGFSWVYINRHLQVISKVMQKAFSKGYCQHNPLSGYEYKHDPPRKLVYLTKEEFIKWKNYQFASPKLQRAADLFLFGCDTSFAYCDMSSFNPGKDIATMDGQQWINKYRQKSHIEHLLPLFPLAAKILKKHGGKLPMLSLDKYNDYIDECADILGIEKKIRSHAARKTFAMLRLEEGWSLEAIAKMMGHKSTQQTQNVYAKVTYKRISLEMKKVGVKRAA